MNVVSRFLRVLVTLAVVLLAIFMLVQVWDVYMRAPWTRDGRVMAQTVIVAPEVSGTVVAMNLSENQLVHQGDILYRLDPTRFTIALDQAQAALDAAQLQLKQQQQEFARRQSLAGLVSSEDRQNAGIASAIAQARVAGAEADFALAKLNLARATITAPVTGYVTRLRLQVGDYAPAGKPLITIIDANSFRITAYFEETKLSMIHPGSPVSIKLLGYHPRLSGHVESIGRGINDANEAISPLGLPMVNPVFDWVRLAQRIPVDIHIDHIPPGIVLAAGMTCSVDVGSAARHHGIAARLRHWLENNL
jgi:multidrug resistance efflux pump